MTKPSEARYIWYDTRGEGRNRFAAFRRSFRLSKEPDRAELSLFADSSYQLFVNGRFVTLGPARFDHRYPLFDTVDLTSYLQAGENVVAVLVKSFGCKTFRSNSFRGGFVAWGEVAGESVDFCTSPESGWRCRRHEAFADDAIKMSFALDPIDVFRQARDLPGWKEIGYDDRAWPRPIALSKPEHWGELRPRRIPPMKHEEARFELKGTVEPLSDLETVYGFSVPGSDFHGRDQIFEKRGEMHFLVTTRIHSPRRQRTRFGLFWGEYYLNGQRLRSRGNSERLRKDFVVELEPGWNDFLAVEQCHDDAQSFLMAAPRSAEIRLSAGGETENGESDYAFLRSAILDPRQLEELRELGLGQPERSRWGARCDWVGVEPEADDGNPARRSLWDHRQPNHCDLETEELSRHVFRKELYPNGFSFVLKFPHTLLLYPMLSVAGAAGGQIDLCYGERFLKDGGHLHHNIVYQSGDRILPSEDVIDFMTSQPRGARYVRVTVRGARGDVTFRRLRFLTHHYPVESTGWFSCSDAVLNEVWKMCERTQQVNMEDAYVDCVGRERGMYIRDTNIQFHNALAMCGDTALMGRCMELVGQSADGTGKFRAVYPNTGDYTIADFSIEAIEGYWQYYAHSGDLDRIEKDWEAIRRNIEWFNELSEEREDGLLDADWPTRRGLPSRVMGLHGDNRVPESLMDRTGPNASLTFPYLMALERASALAELIGREDEAAVYRRKRETVARSVNRLLWNEELGCFNDNLSGGTQSPHASLWAVIANVADEVQEARIAAYLNDSLENVFINGYDPKGGIRFSPSYSFYIFAGLYRLGLHERAEALMKQGWGWMMAQGAVTALEYFGYSTSSCHAWSACPMYYLSRYALGVSFPQAPDFSVVEVEPMSQLKWAEGAFPIPGTKDAVKVSWRREEGGKRILEVDAPPGVTVIKNDQYEVV